MMNTSATGLEALEDRDLIERTQRGNPQAFGVLVKRYMQRAYYVALGLVGSPEDALDLSQEAFVRAYRHIRTFELDKAFFTWYYQILRNLCFNFLRRKKRHVLRFSEIPEHEVLALPSREQGPEEDLERNELQRRVWRAIEKLTELEREVIVLREFQNLSYREMAEVLQCPVGTVMSRLYNARKHLAKLLKEE